MRRMTNGQCEVMNGLRVAEHRIAEVGRCRAHGDFNCGEGGGAKLLELDEPRGRWFECERREGGEVISIKSRGGSFAKASVD